MSNTYHISNGLPYPLGSTLQKEGVNFAIFSEHADKIELCIFDSSTQEQTQCIPINQSDNDIWHVFLDGAQAGLLYGYRVYGPYEPQRGHRFNPKKLLLDPYGKKIVGELKWKDSLYGYDKAHAQLDLIICEKDSANDMPKCEVIPNLNHEQINEIDQNRPHTPWEKTIIYETHVKGLSQLNEKIAPNKRGKYTGLAEDETLLYLKELGITAIELLPIHGFASEAFLDEQALSNYWGYNSINFFAPHQPYAGEDALEEFRLFTKRAHYHGLEVILDVVYNHTAEGNRNGPTLSFKGIDNKSYYCLQAQDYRYYVNDTGCGNTLNARHPRVMQMILDSLRFWVEQMGVDGFRFDLATVLGREHHGFDTGAGFFDAIKQDPVLARAKLIAEPWDIGPGGYQLGAYPKGWVEWNDKYRDITRRFWRGDVGVLPEFARRIHGSSDIFEPAGRSPYSSVNFITSHDGFTLADLVSYNDRHNHANKENNSDGHHSNFSFNHGVEGKTDDPFVGRLRLRQQRNMIATLILSQGTPMILGGDEFGRSQNGNNNAYCQDNEINWFDWRAKVEQEDSLVAFTKKVIALRKQFSLLTSSHYIHRDDEPHGKISWSVKWVNMFGEPMKDAQWAEQHAHCVGWVLEKLPADKHAQLNDLEPCRLLILFNASIEDIEFVLPHYKNVSSWRCVLDTRFDDGDAVCDTWQASTSIMLMTKSLQVLSAIFDPG